MKIYQPERKTIFVTFYSFKGGVGRTMALVNAACILAGRGRRVLMIDFDLEAPGLTMLALKQLASPTQTRPAGLVDLILDVLTDPANSPLADKKNPARYVEYVCSLNIPEHLIRMEGGKLDLMPCGRLDAGYEERLYSIDFAELYAEGIGQPLFKHLRNLIRNSKLYDYILIDSRTGFSDEGGISTRDLADHIVVLTGLNRQNINGTVRFLTRLKASGWKEGEVVFILSPIPIGYEELRAERIDYAQKEIEEKTGFKADFDLHIPYHPRLALDEEPFVYNWTKTDLFRAYESVCKMLQELAEDTPFGWFSRAGEAVRNGRFYEGVRYLHLAQADPEEIEALIPLMLWQIEQEMPRKLGSRNDYLTRKELGILKMLIGDITDGREMAENAINSLEVLNALDDAARANVDYAQVLLRIDEPQTALKHLNENWDGIQRYLDADEQAEAHVLRGQIRLKLNDAAGAIEDAEAALKFYRAQNVYTQSAKDAEELLQKAKERLK